MKLFEPKRQKNIYRIKNQIFKFLKKYQFNKNNLTL